MFELRIKMFRFIFILYILYLIDLKGPDLKIKL